jgi:iron(III) transport system substrate-binding protein
LTSRRTFLTRLAALSLAVPLAACAAPVPTPTTAPQPTAAPDAAAKTEGELVLYSARKEELMQPVVDGFSKATGVKVTLKSGAAGELALLVEQEKAAPLGDVLFTTDAGTTESLREKALLEPYKAAAAEKVPAEFKAADGSWTGIVGRSRNIVYNTNLVKDADLPKSVAELTDPKWKGKLTMASIREGSVRLWLSSLVVQKGEDEAVKFVKALLDNGMKVLPNHTEVGKAVSRGEFPLGLTNHYYYTFEKRANQPVGLIYPDQGPNDAGTLVVPLSVAILKGAKHPQAARAFVDYALSPEGQKPFMSQEAEFSLVPGVPLGDSGVPGIKTIEEIKRAPVTVAQLAAVQEKAVKTFTPMLGGA